jgi:hypothetical protein
MGDRLMMSTERQPRYIRDLQYIDIDRKKLEFMGELGALNDA